MDRPGHPGRLQSLRAHANLVSASVELVRCPELTDTVPYAYAAVPRAGTRLAFFAGACPLDLSGRVVSPGDVAAQARQCVANLDAALRALDASLADLVMTRVLVASSSRADLSLAWTVVRAAVGDHDAPSTLHGVTVLGWPDQLVELEAVAAVPSR